MTYERRVNAALAMVDAKAAQYAEWLGRARECKDHIGVSVNTARFAAMTETRRELGRILER